MDDSISHTLTHHHLVLSFASATEISSFPIFDSSSYYGTSDAQTTGFLNYCKIIGLEHILGLPSSILPNLLDYFSFYKSYGKEKVVQALQKLFTQFLLQDPREVNPLYPATRKDQINTLNMFVSITETLSTQYPSMSVEISMAKDWQKLVKQMLLPSSSDKGMDLRDVGWILDGYVCDQRRDPFDIRDIHWMLNGMDPRPRDAVIFDRRMDQLVFEDGLLQIERRLALLIDRSQSKKKKQVPSAASL